MISFFQHLFDTEGFPPRWTCGDWSAGHGWLHILSDLAIAGAYGAIPVMLVYFIRSRKDMPFTPIFWLFAMFIISCGFGHLIESSLFWHPWYRFSGLVKAITAIVSWMTVFALYQAIPQALALPGLAKVNRQLTDEIAERKHAEKSLRESEEKFRVMADSISPLSWIARADGFIHWFNRRWYDYTGTTPQQMEGWGWQTVNDPEILPKVMEQWKASIANGRPFEMTFPLRAADGKYRRFLTRIQPIRNEVGEVTQWFGTSTDVEEQQRVELALRESERQLNENQTSLKAHSEQLEKTVESRTQALHETIAELQHFSYAIVHDLRSPLRALEGYGQLIEDELESGQVDMSKEYVRRIRIASQRMDNLITDSLTYSKVSRLELALVPVDLFQLIDGMIQTYPNLRPETARIRIDPHLPMVLGNEAALTQCFSNLLQNAIKFTKEGEIPDITVKAEDVPGSPDNGRFVRIWVEDKGVGIDDEWKEKIFDLFQRERSDREGTGIGLAIVRKVVERMGGKVGIESKAGEGSRFWVELQRA